MKHFLIFASTFLMVMDAVACSNLSPIEQRRKDQADTSEQKIIVSELASHADAVYLGRAVDVSDSGDSARFEVLRTLKGSTLQGQVVTLNLTNEVVVGCTVSATFKNISALKGREYVLYVRNGTLTRTGSIERRFPEISVREELSQIAKALAPSKAIEPTR